nr:leucine--tRNA ligase [Methanococcus voltae]
MKSNEKNEKNEKENVKKLNFTELADKWQKIWDENKIFETEYNKYADADGNPSKEKFFITAAFPYLNGVLHAGHLRTFTIPETLARYNRMKDKNVLWTFGYHVTGTPILGLAELIKNRNEHTIWAYNNLHKILMDELLTLNTPQNIVNCFSEKATEAFKKMGFSLDWRRNFKTDDEVFSKFIEWQFCTLKEKGYISKGSHPVRYCPNCDNPVEDHDLLHGEEATTVEYTLIKFTTKYDDKECIVPMATLRPETVFGVTNAWVNPNETYILAEVYDEVQKMDSEEINTKFNGYWIMGKECAYKLSEQDKKIDIIKEMQGSELIENNVMLKNPVSQKMVPLFPANFVEMDIGTGCVMSVPAHAPYDYIALKDLGAIAETPSDEANGKVSLIGLINIDGYGKFPAKEIVEKLGIKNQDDDELLEQATSKIYKDEFHKGKLNENCGIYEGIPVKDIKEKLTKDHIANGFAEVMYEFSEQNVVCRCGQKCIIKTVKGQWFITYSDDEWKRLAHECIDGMNFKPESFRQEFHNKVDWMKDKACARRKGLGTRLPFDNEWMIESLSDSTIYMAYYTIARFINVQNISIDQLKPELFDYVFLGKGELEDVSGLTNISKETILDMRREFLYFYPLDWRCSAKDLVPNHLTFMIFNHVAIFGEQNKGLWPRGIEVNGYVTIEGKKLSKSKGPVLPVMEVAEKYGADVGRFYITTCAELPQDADIKFKEMEKARDNLTKFYEMALDLKDVSLKVEETKLSRIDKWLLHKLYNAVIIADEAYTEFQLRKISILFYELMNDLRWYKRRGGENKSVLREVIAVWNKLLMPITPHLCEEIWQELGYEGFVSLEKFPIIKQEFLNNDLERGEEFIKSTMEDTRSILSVAKIQPSKIYVYTADDWKYNLMEFMHDNQDKNVKQIIPLVMQNVEFKQQGKAVVKLINEFMKIGVKNTINEDEILENAKEFLSSEFDAEIIVNGEDIMNKKKFAIPYKIAIYME